MAGRGNVWLGAAGLVVSKNGEWLVVKKKYGGLKGVWSLPAGFVNEGETVDEAAVREVREETGVCCTVKGMVGLRTGVIRSEISDNMVIFLMEPEENNSITIQETELSEAKYMLPEELIREEKASVMLQYLLNLKESSVKPAINGVDPGSHFQYIAYKLFL
ncbi:NUDIX domain-containing protein [Mesobacillus zeae]|uniref:NUDIX domain-containing protein n=1 Tax=Mesobacillus zeae TaxID=1917180 RepID=A0A398BF40_9BACI|nr:NUDIX domain-containing protein [Mesobacillus zeae]RID88865.1 NUDIX domain-containing protein [Mesobacillus zeae]